MKQFRIEQKTNDMPINNPFEVEFLKNNEND